MKYILTFIEFLLNPFFSIITINEKTYNKSIIQVIKHNHFILLIIALVITLAVVFIYYHKFIFGV